MIPEKYQENIWSDIKYGFIREKESDKYDMRGYFYLIDPRNYSIITRQINVLIEGWNDIYQNAKVTIYMLHRETHEHKKWNQFYFKNIVNQKTGARYKCEFTIPERDIKDDWAYGYIIER